MDEILALHVAILSFAWRKASEKGIVDPKYRDTVTAAVAGEAEGRYDPGGQFRVHLPDRFH